jgi:sodium-dependent dicarboxylate transporter 2/3/5
MAFVGDLPVFFVIISVVAIIAVVTEFSSNTAVASVFLPVLATMAAASNSHPMLFLFSGTVASSFAYMLPSGTGTNAVVFASGRVTIPAMARAGLGLKIISIILFPIFLYLIRGPLFGLSQGVPDWAK